ncbi:MAG: helix-turn-helix transcriptional regulator [Myxococcales bacterium]|nr:helix-turn-helix transcriptional regulator [Myxococcales bacterium]
MSASPSRVAHAGIVGAAAQVFARLGFAATRVEDILGAAGIARRTFYKAFSGKEEVLAAVYQLAIQELLGEMADAAEHAQAPLDILFRGIDVYLDYHVTNARLLRVLVEQALRSDSPIYAARRRFRAELVRLLDEAVRSTTGKEHDALLYLALVSALEGVSLELLAGEPDARAVARAKEVIREIVTKVL